MDWSALYARRTMTAEEAVRQIRSGDRVVISHACGEPSHLLDALVANAAAYRDVEIIHMIPMGSCAYCRPEYAENFRHNALFVGGNSRRSVFEGPGDFTPCYFFEIPRLFATGALPVDVALVTVTPPDENGMCSLGVSVDYTYGAVKRAKLVIAQVNRFLPRTCGQTCVHVAELDCIVPFDAPILEHAPSRAANSPKSSPYWTRARRSPPPETMWTT